MNDPIPPPSRYRHDVPRELDAIVLRALARTPVDRYDSAEEMGYALDAFLATQPKCDARLLGRMLQAAFGHKRADAKRAIAQSCSLSRNISLVMKLRSEVRSDLAERLDGVPLAEGSDVGESAAVAFQYEPRASNRLLAICALGVLVCLCAGLLYLTRSNDAGTQTAVAAKGQAQVRVESTPQGATITLGGEPTGLKTPATLTGLTGNSVTLRLALPGHRPQTATVELPASGKVTKHFELVSTED